MWPLATLDAVNGGESDTVRIGVDAAETLGDPAAEEAGVGLVRRDGQQGREIIAVRRAVDRSAARVQPVVERLPQPDLVANHRQQRRGVRAGLGV